jgi:hypothetical protein
MNIHSRSYPHQTRLAVPRYVRPPATLFEHFQADPRGATTIKQWREDRVWELLQRPARIHEQASSIRMVTPSMPLHEAVSRVATNRERWRHHGQIKLLDDTVIKEWQ